MQFMRDFTELLKGIKVYGWVTWHLMAFCPVALLCRGGILSVDILSGDIWSDDILPGSHRESIQIIIYMLLRNLDKDQGRGVTNLAAGFTDDIGP